MEHLIHYIEDLVEYQESYELEFKSALKGFPSSFWDTYSSFANTQGGTIVLGVKEKNYEFVAEGLSSEQIEQYKTELWRNLNNKQCVSENILREKDVRVEEFEGKQFLLIFVPRASRTQRPVYRTLNPFGNTFKRNHEGDFKCTEGEIRRMISDSDDSNSSDSRILINYSLDDIDASSLKQYRQLFAIAHPEHAWLSLDDIGLLTRLGAYRKDRRTEEEGFTVAGLLMFGKYDSITDIECCPNYFPDFQENFSPESDIRWTDRIYPDGTWEANIFQFYRRVLPKLTSTLPKPFQLEDAVRIDSSDTHVAVREAFANALIHCDYSADGSIIVKQTPDSFSFSNPGTMLISVTQYYEGGESACRNKSLQKMFLMIGSAEKAGSGADKILKGWIDANWGIPRIQESIQPDRVTLKMDMVSLLPDESITYLKEVFGDKLESVDRNMLIALSVCHMYSEINNEALQLFIQLHSADITKMLKKLCNEGFLSSSGNGRGTKYHINIGSNDDSKLSNDDSKGPNLDSKLSNDDSKPLNLDSKSPNLDSKSANLDSKKLSFEKLEIEICFILKDEFMSAEQIAKKLNRSVDYLKNTILPRLIDRGSIVRQFPDTPKHPQQKFKAANNQNENE